MLSILENGSMWVRPHLHNVTITFMVMVLALYGDYLFRLIKKIIYWLPFIVRALVFMAVGAFGLPFLVILCFSKLEVLLSSLNNYILLPIIILGYIILALLAEMRVYSAFNMSNNDKYANLFK